MSAGFRNPSSRLISRPSSARSRMAGRPSLSCIRNSSGRTTGRRRAPRRQSSSIAVCVMSPRAFPCHMPVDGGFCRISGRHSPGQSLPPPGVLSGVRTHQRNRPVIARHVVVYHGYNEQLFPGRAHLKALLGSNWIALEPPGGRPSSKGEVTSFVRETEASAVFAAYALPVLGDTVDLKIRSIVPIGHPVARAFVNYRRRVDAKTAEASV